MRAAVLIGLSLAIAGCASVIDVDDPATLRAAGPRCDPVSPHAPSEPRLQQACASYQTCRIDGAGTACRVVSSDVSYEFGYCTQESDCAGGTLCTNLAVCVPLCVVGSTCFGRPCHAFQPAIRADDIEYGYCAGAMCDPFGGADECGGGTCHFVSETETTCLGVIGRLSLGAACDASTSCPRGAVCDDGVCRALCRPSASSCAGGRQCVPTNVSYDGEVLGTCR